PGLSKFLRRWSGRRLGGQASRKQERPAKDEEHEKFRVDAHASPPPGDDPPRCRILDLACPRCQCLDQRPAREASVIGISSVVESGQQRVREAARRASALSIVTALRVPDCTRLAI